MTKRYKITIHDKLNNWKDMSTEWVTKEIFDRIYSTIIKPSMFGADNFEVNVIEEDAICIEDCMCGGCIKKPYCIGCDCSICENHDCQVNFCNSYEEK